MERRDCGSWEGAWFSTFPSCEILKSTFKLGWDGSGVGRADDGWVRTIQGSLYNIEEGFEIHARWWCYHSRRGGQVCFAHKVQDKERQWCHSIVGGNSKLLAQTVTTIGNEAIQETEEFESPTEAEERHTDPWDMSIERDSLPRLGIQDQQIATTDLTLEPQKYSYWTKV